MKIRFHLPDFTHHFHLNHTLAAMLKNCPEFCGEARFDLLYNLEKTSLSGSADQ